MYHLDSRGHLTFFRNTPQASKKITGHPDFATKEGWLGMKNFHHKLGKSQSSPSFSSALTFQCRMSKAKDDWLLAQRSLVFELHRQ